ncbi:hypothetical protein JKI95_02910 [Corynebacterium aquatimens]|uniref:hypothetical protein n=1 Tax=Corynebacterium aquatimens TaxID=1190508 RepID=UPI002541DCEC|nr:hypothetical protein [Corynebacterium aquatimens]QYH20009.1 hypothetical protein JKI95_02910 [Corynebacterium aquatimens]
MSTATPNPNDPKRTGDAAQTRATDSNTEEHVSTNAGGGSNRWLWWVGLLLAAILLFFGFRSCSGGDQEQPTSPPRR